MNALARFALVATAAQKDPSWRRYQDPATGLSFEAPFEMVNEDADGTFGTLVEGRMTLPYVFDISFMASRDASDASPKTLAHEMATQWMVDYAIPEGVVVRRVEISGVDEAWSVRALIEDEAGNIDYSWTTLSAGGRIGCLGVSCWAAERLGREAQRRALVSLSGL